MQAVSQFFREEKDFLFQRGEAIGEARGAEKERVIAEAKIREERTKAEAKIREEKRTIAMKLRKLGISVTDIAKGTGLTPDEIEGL